jgi:hypothetical protein
MAEGRTDRMEATLSASIHQSLETVKAQIDRLAFGSIALTIHDGKVVQLEVTEKRRLT